MSNANKTIVVFEGKPGKKFINGELVNVTPFVGYAGSEFGVGISVAWEDGTENNWLWGLISPRELIRSWRAMKLLEDMPRIEIHGTPSMCMALARERLRGYDEKYLDKVGELFGDYDQFREIRANVLASYPTPLALSFMLGVIKKHGIKILTGEIDECKRKLEAPSVILERLIAFDNKRREAKFAEVVAEAERLTIPSPARLPKRQSFFKRYFW